jgi:4-alpha-glucanotransferase
LHAENQNDVEEQIFYQYVVESQWQRLRKYANDQGVQIVGDLPIYVDHDSVDVWLNQSQFALNSDGLPVEVSGVPPDNYAVTGQLWGHPIYNWARQEQEGYPWWLKRMKRCLEQTDIVRIDHFRGFAAYWSVPFGSKDAANGKWVTGPGISFFRAMQKEFGKNLPVIAEDLGYIDAPVHKLKEDAGLPGMCVLEFGFSNNEDIIHHPSNHPEFSVCYTGTHDNQTVVQWRGELTAINKLKLAENFAHDKLTDRQFAWKFVELAFSSKSKLCVVPLQDFLGEGKSARMNFPSTIEGNWEYRALDGSLTMELAAEIRARLSDANRL